MEDGSLPPSPQFTPEINEVIRSESVYIRQRRAFYEEERPQDTEAALSDLWGLTFSGGGIRSATLALGLMQKLIVAGVFKKFDYLSTVSGGGYMGACLSSLMNNEPEAFYLPPEYQDTEKRMRIPGLEFDTSPFVHLIETQDVVDETAEVPEEVPPARQEAPQMKTRGQLPSMSPESEKTARNAEGKRIRKEVVLNYKGPEETRIDVRHQIHHLRTHGEYLTPDKGLLSVDVQKALGTILGGIFHNFFLFFLALTSLVAIHYLFFDWISSNQLIDTLSNKVSKVNGEASFWQHGFVDYMVLVLDALTRHYYYTLGAVALGFLVSMGFIRFSGISSRKFRRWDERKNVHELEGKIPAGHDHEDFFERQFLARVNMVNIIGALGIGLGLFGYGWMVGDISREDYWIFFGLPACYSLGIFLGIYFVLAYFSQSPRQLRYARSLHGALRGGAFYGLVISFATPILLILLFSLSLFWKGSGDGTETNSNTLISTISSLVSVLAGYFTLNRSESGDSASLVNKIINQVKTPLLSLSVLLFIGLSTYSIIRILSSSLVPDFPMWALLVCAVAFLITGVLVDSNKLSLHYFYRDRLSESFLRTDGRVKRKDDSRQGMPLINLRNDEDLPLKDLGWMNRDGAKIPNARAPYHLIVTALNLQGTDELVRKDLKSDHFVFSRNYIGSNSTGYVRTDIYRRGKTKLARAMTISAAAVGSGMGFTSFFAQSFITTLLNLRLGYWMENPWFYRELKEATVSRGWPLKWKKLWGWQEIGPGKDDFEVRIQSSPERKYTFWPGYLLREMLGLTAANTRLVNLSDGGHTGDNLGLLPLLRRRCKFIVACDFEEDRKFGFGSFNHLVRMANIEEDIEILIDLKPLEPTSTKEDEAARSYKSVAVGTIRYPDNTNGILLYCKSSLNRRPLPVNVYNYRKLHHDFPHETTADQYFDDAQFEAYRSLGFHIGEEAIDEIQKRRSDVKIRT